MWFKGEKGVGGKESRKINDYFYSDLWFRSRTCRWSWAWSHRLLNRIRGHSMVSRPRNHAQFQGLHEVDRYLVGWMYSRWNALQPPHLPRKALLGSVEPHFGRFGFTIARGLELYSEREGTQLLAIVTVQAEGSMENALPAGWSESPRFVGENAYV